MIKYDEKYVKNWLEAKYRELNYYTPNAVWEGQKALIREIAKAFDLKLNVK